MTAPTYFIGLDNGHTGALAVLHRDGTFEDIWETPTVKYGTETRIDEKALWAILASFEPDQCFITFEAGQKQPQFGTKGNFTNGVSHGTIRTLVALSGIAYQEVDPATWQRPILRAVRGAGTNTKGASLEFCRRNWPSLDLRGHDGMSDALCLAEFGRRLKLQGAVSDGSDTPGRAKRKVKNSV